MVGQTSGQTGPVPDADTGFHRDMGHQREDAVAQLAGKAVHHGQHGDEAGHAQSHAEQAHHRDHADEAVALAAEAVAQADEQLQVQWPLLVCGLPVAEVEVAAADFTGGVRPQSLDAAAGTLERPVGQDHAQGHAGHDKHEYQDCKQIEHGGSLAQLGVDCRGFWAVGLGLSGER